jgi:hypothetical protein
MEKDRDRLSEHPRWSITVSPKSRGAEYHVIQALMRSPKRVTDSGLPTCNTSPDILAPCRHAGSALCKNLIHEFAVSSMGLSQPWNFNIESIFPIWS